MRRHVFHLMLMVLCLASCVDSYDNPLHQLSEKSRVEEGLSNLFSYEEIIDRANQYYLQLPEGTRSEAPEVKEVVPLKSSTRSDEQPLYVVVNYDDNAGFAIMGANASADDMIAISNEGNLNLSDTVFNKGLAAFIRAANAPAALTVPPIEKDTSIAVKPPIINNVSVAPLLHSNVRMWGQETPFSTYTPMVSQDGVTKHAPVCCVALSTAMMMSYYEWPETHNGRSYNWREIKNSMGTDDLFYLLWELGKPGNLNVTYGFENSSSHTDYCYRTFENYDYTINDCEITLEQIDLTFYSTVRAKLPLLMGAFGIYQGQFSGHVWVIDGLLHLPKYNAFEQIRDEDKYYFHCVWGCYGYGNGYYAYDKLKGIGGVRDRECPDDNVYPGHSDSSTVPIFSNCYGIYSIKPNK